MLTHVAIPSFNRAGRVTTLDVCPSAFIYVPSSQAEDYRRHYPDRVIEIPDALDGSIARKRNAVLDRSPSPWTVLLDDDITEIGCWENGQHITLSPAHLEWLIDHGMTLAQQLGVKYWGMLEAKDPKFYNTYKPFSFTNKVLGAFRGHLDWGQSPLRYDERQPTLDDFDMWLQALYHQHKILRFERYHVLHNQKSLVGGIRYSTDLERTGLAELQRKWGPVTVKNGSVRFNTGLKGC